MSRIRSIKPEIYVSSQMSDCSHSARWLFVGMWSFCDDAGRHPNDAMRLKMEVFPGDVMADPKGQVAAWLDELIAVGLLEAYTPPGSRETYLQVTGWFRHQRIDRPSFKHPGPDGKVPSTMADAKAQFEGIRRPFDEESPNTLRAVDEDSTDATPRTGPDRTGPEWSRVE